MKKTKIYNVLSHFNKYEQNRLRKFLLSPYFNSDESIVLLFELIVKYLNGNQKKIWKKVHYGQNYPGKKNTTIPDLENIVPTFWKSLKVFWLLSKSKAINLQRPI